MSDTRRELLRHLLHEKAGLTVDELSRRLGISRSGVQQHLANLERDRLVHEVTTRNTGAGGRPSRVFALTDRGLESFPRQYALISTMTLKALSQTAGEGALPALLEKVAEELFHGLRHRVEGKEGSERLEAVVEILNELGYEAERGPDGGSVSAVNCVYHHLAREVRDVCRLDIELLSRLTGKEIGHALCMADGDGECLFRLVDPAEGRAEPDR